MHSFQVDVVDFVVPADAGCQQLGSGNIESISTLPSFESAFGLTGLLLVELDERSVP